ncbi:MAG TPA: hypothetical protein ENN17_02975 [bacterium]|nr:hypothetical protein [bacterium]
MTGSRRKEIVFLCALCLFLSPRETPAQGLAELRREIDRLERTLREKTAQERSLLEIVEDLNREIGLRQKLLQTLESERVNMERQIDRSRKELSKTESDFAERKEQVSRRLVSMYKRGRTSDLEILLSVRHFNQVLVWLRYQQRILEHHRRNLRQLLHKRTEIERITRRLETESREKTRLITEAQEEKTRMEARKQAQQGPLSRVRKDKDLVTRQIEEKKRAYAQIEKRIIAEEARQKTEREIERLGDVKFETLKGRLPWPVPGRITERYGRMQHPLSKTWYDNLGVDIATESNAVVRAVADGRVIHIDWLRGRGHVVLVDHGGYYTVYGHLAMVETAPGEYLGRGDMLGQVGDSQSLYGASLHFEVWKGTAHMDPAGWLGK